MLFRKAFLVLSLALPAVALAAPGDRNAAGGPAPSGTVDSMAVGAATSDPAMESLPDLPVLTRRALRFDTSAAKASPTGYVLHHGDAMSDRKPLPDAPGVSLLQSLPLAGAARHMGAANFNTDDGSSLSAFAICYRLNRRSSVQVIPGDPAPVKIPVTSMSNNVGLTVGMVVRLSGSR